MKNRLFIRPRNNLRNALLLVLLLVPATPPSAGAQAVAVDLELILMADASGSIDHDEFQLQRRGYARALMDPRVFDAIRSGRHGRIAISYVEWSGPEFQHAIVPWTLISDKADLEFVAGQLIESPREIFYGGTAPGNAILYGVLAIEANGFLGRRRVIDVSGDDSDIDGVPAKFGRDQAVAQGMTVNGLPILDDWPPLGEFFRDNIIGGPGAFFIPATGFRDFELAIRRKLIREIAGQPGAQQEAKRPGRPHTSRGPDRD